MRKFTLALELSLINLSALCSHYTATNETNKKQPQPQTTKKLEASLSEIPPQDFTKDDRVHNYGSQVIKLGVLLMQLHYTEKGHCDRNVRM